MLKIFFLGTPALAVPFLERLHQKTSVAAVITTPDQPAGRGYALKAPAVKEAALRLGLPVFQPESLKNPLPLLPLPLQRGEGGGEGKPDLGVVVAYGKLLPKDFLAIPKHGFLNVHFSLLPKYRGAAPIQWALINGETETGVTLFWLDEGMDTGPILLQKKVPILPEDDADSLRNKLVDLGVICLEEALGLIDAGNIKREPQVGAASKAAILKKEDGRIDWAKPAEAIWNQMRGMTPWPGTYTGHLKILKAHPVLESAEGEFGSVIRVVSGEGPIVKCGKNSLALIQVQPEGKKPMPARSWWQGARLKVGDKLG
jgi:methionyl-tRNA formyltransferase